MRSLHELLVVLLMGTDGRRAKLSSSKVAVFQVHAVQVLKLTRFVRLPLGLVPLPLTSITHEQIMMQGPRKFCELSRGKEESSLCCFHCFNKL